MPRSFVIREDSTFRSYWDLLIVIMILVSTVWVTYAVAFVHTQNRLASGLFYLIDLIFWIDIGLNFATTFKDRGMEVLDPESIRRSYSRGLFPVDLVANFPLDLFLLWSHATVGGVSIVLLLRLTRLLRVPRMLAIFKRWERLSWTQAGYLRIARLLALVILAVHFVACLWFFIPFAQHLPADSWVFAEGLDQASPPVQYLRSLYWVVVTMTAVGYGDITPVREIEYLISIFVVLLGASLYAFVIANVASHLASLNAARSSFWNRVEASTQYLRARRIPPETTDKVQKYYEYVWAQYGATSRASLFEDLPAPLRREVLFHLTRDLLDKVPLFRKSSPVLRNELLVELDSQTHLPGSIIALQGATGDGIYFVARGVVEIGSSDGRRYGTLTTGEYFGDLSLLLGERRTASVTAKTHCDILLLRKQSFERIRREYPEFREVLKEVSREKSARISELMLEGVIL